MKLLEQNIVRHQRGSIGDNHQYVVEQNSKVMDIFSNMLYQDKIAAPIRELATNAWDAHVQAETTHLVPVVTLPTHESPIFKIRDFGTGLSKAQIAGDKETGEVGIYRTYGHSTKNHSNDFNGCMGIGSKSPFAYTRSFTTTSWHNGTKLVYINAKDEHNMPSLQLFYEGPTDEPNGLEVSFAVEKKHISQFHSKATEILQWFPKQFDCDNSKIDWPKYTYKFEGNGWKLRGDRSDSVAIMGYIQYPIEIEHFQDEEDKDISWYRKENKYTKLLNLGLELYFDIGEVEMSASREGLQYTPATITHIRRRLDLVLKELKEQIEKKFEGFTHLWDARLFYNTEISSNFSSVKDLVKYTAIEFKGKSLMETYKRKDWSVVDDKGNIIRTLECRKYAFAHYSKPRLTLSPEEIDANAKVVLFIGDLERGNDVRVKEYLCEKGKYVCNTAYLFNAKTPSEIQRIKDGLDINDSHIIYTSTLPKPERSKSGVVRKEKIYVYNNEIKIVKGDHVRQSGYWNVEDVDFNKGGLYVQLNNWNVSDAINGHIKNNRAKSIRYVLDILESLKIKLPRIVGVKTAVLNKYKKSPAWNCFFKWAENKVTERINRVNIGEYIGIVEAIRSFDNAEAYNSLVKTEKIENSESPLKILVDKLEEYSTIATKWSNKIESYQTASRHFNLDLGKTNTNILNELKEKAHSRYKCLDLVDFNGWWSTSEKNKDIAILVELINIIDKCSGV